MAFSFTLFSKFSICNYIKSAASLYLDDSNLGVVIESLTIFKTSLCLDSPILTRISTPRSSSMIVFIFFRIVSLVCSPNFDLGYPCCVYGFSHACPALTWCLLSKLSRLVKMTPFILEEQDLMSILYSKCKLV